MKAPAAILFGGVGAFLVGLGLEDPALTALLLAGGAALTVAVSLAVQIGVKDAIDETEYQEARRAMRFDGVREAGAAVGKALDRKK